MNRDELVAHIGRLLAKYEPLARNQEANRGHVLSEAGIRAEAEEFLRNFAGQDSAFYKALASQSSYWSYSDVVSILNSFREYAEAGLLDAVSPERQAQFEVVSEILDQSATLLDDSAVHPAAATMLVGATLEEYLRAWVERAGLTIGQRHPGIQAYSEALRDAGALTKQDIKNVTAWAGFRNHAAHGEWDEVSDPREIRMMLQGVNLLMQKYGA